MIINGSPPHFPTHITVPRPVTTPTHPCTTVPRCYGPIALQASLRILRDVVVYRIRNREMANLASSLSIMLALRLDWFDTAMRFLFAIAGNAAVYLVNDIFDVAADHASQTKDTCKAAFLKAHQRDAWRATWIPLTVMTAIGVAWNRELLIVMLAIGAALFAYSARLKRIAYLDLPTVFVCGVVGSTLAFPLDRAIGWCLAGLLGCFVMCFQTVQMVRDHDEDSDFGTRTTAVALGTRSTIALQRVLLVIAALYTALLVHRWIGTAMLLTVLLPFQAKEAGAHWNRIRLALGFAWLAIIGWVLWKGSLDGILVQLQHNASLW